MFGCPTIFDAKVDLHESSKCLELYLTNSSFWTKKKNPEIRSMKQIQKIGSLLFQKVKEFLTLRTHKVERVLQSSLDVQDLSAGEIVEHWRKLCIILSPSILILSLKLNDCQTKDLFPKNYPWTRLSIIS